MAPTYTGAPTKGEVDDAVQTQVPYRHNVVGYLALFFALTGVAYAAGPLKSGDPAGRRFGRDLPEPVSRKRRRRHRELQQHDSGGSGNSGV